MTSMRPETERLAQKTKGFLAPAEAAALSRCAALASLLAPCLEIGTYCGKSTLYLGEGCRAGGVHPLLTVDHHRGSEEQQPGQEYFDAELYDEEDGVVSTLRSFMRTLRRADLDDWIVPIVAPSRAASRALFGVRLGLLFIDGGHTEEAAFGDYHAWSDRVVSDGLLLIHDVFPDPSDGGQAPYHVLQHALGSGQWAMVEQVETLAILRRLVGQWDGQR